MLSKVQQLKHLIEQSESVILINLDRYHYHYLLLSWQCGVVMAMWCFHSQRNVMMRLSVQLEMGMFSATVCGLIGVAFGMNLDSYLEEVTLQLEVNWLLVSLLLCRLLMPSGVLLG